MPSSLAALALLAPALLVAVALLGMALPGLRPHAVLLASRLATIAGLILAFLAAALVIAHGPLTSKLIGSSGLGFSVRLDAVSCSMFLLVAFIGLIVIQYSRNYLDGDARQGAFLGGLCLTLAAVMLLVLAGNLVQLAAAWIATSLSLHRLLVFYRERPAALIAARKKFITARIGDACLIGACVLLAKAFGSSDIASILAQAHQLDKDTSSATTHIAAWLIGFAALLKSAQFPTHGWLPEVMETPTPVSALLHAGIINAGGFLVIRFAEVMLLSAPSLHLIAIVGGFTALFGGVVMLTQTSVKASLAWSTIAQMGFMLLQCGFGAFSIALLHIVAHSLYKAHAFLSSGSIIEISRSAWKPDMLTKPQAGRIIASLVLALLLYASTGWLFGMFTEKSAAVISLGAILIMGLSLLIAESLQGRIEARVIGRIVLAAGAASCAYFLLQKGAAALTASTLPIAPPPDSAGVAIMVLVIVSFATVTLLQILAPTRSVGRAWRIARVHLANGLYVNACFNRLVGALRRPATSTH